MLGLDFTEMDVLNAAASIRRKYGEAPLLLFKRNPELEPIEHAWKKLTAAQKKDAITMILTWAEQA